MGAEFDVYFRSNQLSAEYMFSLSFMRRIYEKIYIQAKDYEKLADLMVPRETLSVPLALPK